MDFLPSPSDPPYRSSSPPALEEEPVQAEEKNELEEAPAHPIGWVLLIVTAIECCVFFFLPFKETIVTFCTLNLVGFSIYKIRRYEKRLEAWKEMKEHLEKEKTKKETMNLKVACNTLVYESKNDLAARFRRANSHITQDTADEVEEWVRVKRL